MITENQQTSLEMGDAAAVIRGKNSKSEEAIQRNQRDLVANGR